MEHRYVYHYPINQTQLDVFISKNIYVKNYYGDQNIHITKLLKL